MTPTETKILLDDIRNWHGSLEELKAYAAELFKQEKEKK